VKKVGLIYKVVKFQSENNSSNCSKVIQFNSSEIVKNFFEIFGDVKSTSVKNIQNT
jgi:hypothetical protein